MRQRLFVTIKQLLFGVQFDDKCFVDFYRNFVAFGHTGKCAFEAVEVLFDVRYIESLQFLERFFVHFVGTGSFFQSDNGTNFNVCRRDVAAFAIDQDVAVVDHLTCLADGVCKTDTVYQVIQTAFQQFQIGRSHV